MKFKTAILKTLLLLILPLSVLAGTNSGGTATRVTPPGAGGYTAGTVIKSSVVNGEINDIYTELTDRLSRSGKGNLLANIAANGYKITGLANGSASGDSVHYGQFAATLATPGLQTLPTGFIEKWGQITVGTTPTSFNFASAFPTACIAVQLIGNHGPTIYFGAAYSWTVSAFIAVSNSASGVGYVYRAIGY